METITLADGTVIENAHVSESDGRLYFYIENGMTLAEVFAVMIDQEKTATITGLRYQQETVYEGYTDLESIRKDGGQISGGIRRAMA